MSDYFKTTPNAAAVSSLPICKRRWIKSPTLTTVLVNHTPSFLSFAAFGSISRGDRLRCLFANVFLKTAEVWHNKFHQLTGLPGLSAKGVVGSGYAAHLPVAASIIDLVN
jgi:hypothetical protein